jgi:hypothetical protein
MGRLRIEPRRPQTASASKVCPGATTPTGEGLRGSVVTSAVARASGSCNPAIRRRQMGGQNIAATASPEAWAGPSISDRLSLHLTKRLAKSLTVANLTCSTDRRRRKSRGHVGGHRDQVMGSRLRSLVPCQGPAQVGRQGCDRGYKSIVMPTSALRRFSLSRERCPRRRFDSCSEPS